MFKRSTKFRTQPKRRFGWIRNKFTVGLLLILILIVAGWYLFKSVKTTYAVKLDETPCTDQEKIKNNLAKNKVVFYWLQSQEIEKKLKQDFPCISQVAVERKLPFSVAVSVTGRKPVAVFRLIQKVVPSPLLLDDIEATASTQAALLSPSPSPQVTISYGETFLIDSKGVAFAKGSKEGLPFVDFVVAKFDIGGSIGDEKTTRLLQIWDFFQKQSIPVSSLEMEDDKLTVNSNEQKIIFSLTEDLERQGASLQLIWKQAKMNSKSVVKIDLRFDKPVIVYAPDKK